MKKNLTELVFIIDRSGSMSGLEADTIGGFNSMIERQKKEDGDAIISTVLFDDSQEVLYNRVPISKIEPMNDKQYYVKGCTALLDSMGGAIQHIGGIHKKLGADCPDKTIFIITTDGMENASRRYNYKKVKDLVSRQKEKYGWEFLFLGANIDAIGEAAKFGIGESRAVRYSHDSEGTKLNYRVLSGTISKMRACKNSMEMSCMLDEEDCFEEIREDYAKRG